MDVVPAAHAGDEAARLRALHEYRVLDTPPEPAFDQLTELAAYVCRTPMALVVFVDERRQWFKSRRGVDVAETPREWAICSHTIDEADLLVVGDAAKDPRFAEIPYVRGAPGVRFYAGTALRSAEGLALGTLCVLDHVPRVLDPGQLDALRALGRQAEAQLELRRQRLRAQQALLDTEERFRALVELSADALTIIGPDAAFSFASPSTRRVLGRAPEDLVGRDVFELMHPDDVDRCRRQLAEALARPGVPIRAEFRYRHADGTWRHIEADGVNRQHESAVPGVVASFRDVSGRVRAQQALGESEERFRQLAESLEDAVWIRSLEPRVLYVSPAFERIWGVGREVLYGDPDALTELIHPEDRAAATAAAAAMAEGHYDSQFRIVRPDGEVRWIRSRGLGIRDPDGVVRRIAGISQDITARKDAEAQLQAQKDLAANLLAVAHATTELPTLDATLARALEVMKRLTGAEAASLLLLDDAGRLTRSLVSAGDGPPGQGDDPRLLEEGLAYWVAAQEQPALVEDVERDTRWRRCLSRAQATRSALCVPILSGRALVGVLTLEHSRPAYFGPGHLELVQAASGQMALALLNAQVFDALDAMAERQATLYEVLRASGAQLDPDGALRQAVAVIAQRTGWPNVAIAVPGADAHWEIRASNESLSRVGRPPLSAGVVGRAYRTGRVQRVPDVRQDPDYVEGSPAICSEVAVPIRRGEQVMGVLNVESDRAGAFGDEEVGLAASLADAVGLALENARLYRAVAAESDRVGSFVRASRDGILLVGAEGTVLLGNDPACRLLGLAGIAENWVGRPLGELLRPLAAAAPGAAAAVAAAATRSGSHDGITEGECARPPYVIHWSARAVLSGGVLLGRSLVLRDVTAERGAQRLQEDLTHTMVHDLRNPLTALQGAVEMLSACEPPLTERQRGLFEIADRSTQRMLALVNAILDVTRLEKGAMPVNPRAVGLTEAAEEVLTFYEHLGRQHRVELANDVPATLPRVAADLHLLERVLHNLVGNALKFTPDGGQVRVAARPYADDDAFLEVVVSDTGPGVPPRVRERLFQKFVTGSAGGTGLGLAFCRLAVEAHAGRIWLGEEPGGAAIHFTLPVHA